MDLNRLGRGALGNAYARLFGVEDPNSVPTLAPEILPTTSIWERVEFWALFGGKLGMCYTQRNAGGVGVIGSMHGTNPTGSGIIAVIERVILATAGVHTMGVERVGVLPPLAGTATQVHRDLRMAPANIANGFGVRWTHADAATAAPHCPLPGLQNHLVEVVLPPGFTFQISGPGNTLVDFGVLWRERPATKQELDLAQ